MINKLYCLNAAYYCSLSDDKLQSLIHKEPAAGRLRNTSWQLFRLTVCALLVGDPHRRKLTILKIDWIYIKLKLGLHTILYRYNTPPIRGWRPKRSNSYCLKLRGSVRIWRRNPPEHSTKSWVLTPLVWRLWHIQLKNQ